MEKARDESLGVGNVCPAIIPIHYGRNTDKSNLLLCRKLLIVNALQKSDFCKPLIANALHTRQYAKKTRGKPRVS